MEDRLATLKNVIREPELDGWNLYLGTPFSFPSIRRQFACSLSNSLSTSVFLGCCFFMLHFSAELHSLEQEIGGTILQKRERKQLVFPE